MSIQFGRVNRLRERVARNVGMRPTFVSFEFVHPISSDRIDVTFRWIGRDRGECRVHTNAKTLRNALRAVERCAHHVAPGVRFHANNPTVQEPLRES